MSIVRLRLPVSDFEKNEVPSRTFIFTSNFRGQRDLITSDLDYEKMVKWGVEELKANGAKKVVLSRLISFPQQGLTSDAIFDKLNKKFPNAAVFAFTDEHGSQWTGATPELLFKKRGNKYSTISLAGTRKVGTSEVWGEKEKEEQRLVTDFIQLELKKNGAERVLCGEVKTRQAGSIEHLCTEIEFEYIGPWKNVMEALHPTPAVCGMPREESMQLIQSIERHDREYYTGLIGIEQGENVDVYVILRCMKLTTSALHVFVGAGITSESVPELESRETKWKAESLTEVIF